MEMFKRKIRLFFVSYGRLLAFVIGVIGIIIFGIQGLNSMAAKQNEKKYYSEEDYQRILEQQVEQELDKKYISQFIDYCNRKEIEQAYNMLSEKCKQEKYNTVKNFEEKYINVLFDINIVDYDILVKDNTYIVTLIQDMLITGKTDSKLETTCTVTGVLEREIYLDN